MFSDSPFHLILLPPPSYIPIFHVDPQKRLSQIYCRATKTPCDAHHLATIFEFLKTVERKWAMLYVTNAHPWANLRTLDPLTLTYGIHNLNVEGSRVMGVPGQSI